MRRAVAVFIAGAHLTAARTGDPNPRDRLIELEDPRQLHAAEAGADTGFHGSHQLGLELLLTEVRGDADQHRESVAPPGTRVEPLSCPRATNTAHWRPRPRARRLR